MKNTSLGSVALLLLPLMGPSSFPSSVISTRNAAIQGSIDPAQNAFIAELLRWRQFSQETWEALFPIPFNPTSAECEVLGGPITQEGVYSGIAAGLPFTINVNEVFHVSSAEILAHPDIPQHIKTLAQTQSFTTGFVTATISTSQGSAYVSALTQSLDLLDGHGLRVNFIPIEEGDSHASSLAALMGGTPHPPLPPTFCPDAVPCAQQPQGGGLFINQACIEQAAQAYQAKKQQANQNYQACLQAAENHHEEAKGECKKKQAVGLAVTGIALAGTFWFPGAIVGAIAAFVSTQLLAQHCVDRARDQCDQDKEECKDKKARDIKNAENDFYGDIAGCCQLCPVKPKKTGEDQQHHQPASKAVY